LFIAVECCARPISVGTLFQIPGQSFVSQASAAQKLGRQHTDGGPQRNENRRWHAWYVADPSRSREAVWRRLAHILQA